MVLACVEVGAGGAEGWSASHLGLVLLEVPLLLEIGWGVG